jgi:dGTPase
MFDYHYATNKFGMKYICDTKGRRLKENDCLLIDYPFSDDIQRIEQSKSHRRQEAKTQVLSLPLNSHIRSRNSHTSEVKAIASTLSLLLGLNTDLCVAIAQGHDMGHTPYGHLGEAVLSNYSGKKFEHDVFGVVLAQKIERNGKGLNLTHETLDGILNHGGFKRILDNPNIPNEFNIVKLADKVAYTFSDLNDALRMDLISEDDVSKYLNKLGYNQRTYVNNVIKAIVEESKSAGYVKFSKGDIHDGFTNLRDFMFDNVYFKIDESEQRYELEKILNYFEFDSKYVGYDPVILTALLSDKEVRYICTMLEDLVNPFSDKKNIGLFEILPYLKGKDIDFTNPDLNWKSFYRGERRVS